MEDIIYRGTFGISDALEVEAVSKVGGTQLRKVPFRSRLSTRSEAIPRMTLKLSLSHPQFLHE
jgi:hypothetical protein